MLSEAPHPQRKSFRGLMSINVPVTCFNQKEVLTESAVKFQDIEKTAGRM
jgi:hypothetical protein